MNVSRLTSKYKYTNSRGTVFIFERDKQPKDAEIELGKLVEIDGQLYTAERYETFHNRPDIFGVYVKAAEPLPA